MENKTNEPPNKFSVSDGNKTKIFTTAYSAGKEFKVSTDTISNALKAGRTTIKRRSDKQVLTLKKILPGEIIEETKIEYILEEYYGYKETIFTSLSDVASFLSQPKKLLLQSQCLRQ